ncbi:MAG: thioesterase [Desulfobacterales bacterium]|nr:thioesterase [Desulfobacterales bacterium]
MPEIEIGLKGIKEMMVEEKDLASFMGNMGADVLSTHRVVLLMEHAARKAIEGRVPEGKMTVGTLIHMRHLAATPLGAKVRAEAHLIEIDRARFRLVFEVVVYDEFEKISEGVNERFIVSVEKFLGKVKKKKVKH